jgi:hypothetical protein
MLTLVSAPKTIGVIRPFLVATATFTSTLLYLKRKKHLFLNKEGNQK